MSLYVDCDAPKGRPILCATTRNRALPPTHIVEVGLDMERILVGVAEIAGRASLRRGAAASELERLSRSGFLVSNYGLGDYNVAAGERRLLAALDPHGAVACFALIYRAHDPIDPGDFGSQFIRQRFGPGTPIVKQVATHPEFTGQGYARALYLELATSMVSDIYAAIVKDPHNFASEAFHRQLGFSEAAIFHHPDGKPRGIWRWLRIHQDGSGSFE